MVAFFYLLVVVSTIAKQVYGDEAVSVTCESWKYKRAECAVPDSGFTAQSVVLQNKMSQSECTIDYSFGITEDGTGIWVDNGCRATFTVTVTAVDDPCSSGVTLIDDASRSTDNGKGYNCDDRLEGWHRFQMDGQDAMIPTTCVENLHCGTFGSMWLDVTTPGLPAEGEEREVPACTNLNSGPECCEYTKTVTIRNCGAFYIYKLPGFYDQCNQAFCLEPSTL